MGSTEESFQNKLGEKAEKETNVKKEEEKEEVW